MQMPVTMTNVNANFEMPMTIFPNIPDKLSITIPIFKEPVI